MTNNDSTADAVGVVEAYMKALQIGDKDTILRLYADEAEIIPENLPSLRGPTPSTPSTPAPSPPSGWRSTCGWSRPRSTTQIALVRSEQPVTVTAVADGTRTEAYFRESFVLRHTPDGWRIHKYMFSQNPGQAEKPAAARRRRD